MPSGETERGLEPGSPRSWELRLGNQQLLPGQEPEGGRGWGESGERAWIWVAGREAPWPGEALPEPLHPPKEEAGFLPLQKSPDSFPWKQRPWSWAPLQGCRLCRPCLTGWAANRLLLALTGLAPSLPTSVSRALCLGEFPILLPRLYSFSPSLASATRENKYFILPGLQGPHTSPTPTGSAKRPVISGNSLSPWIPFLLPDPPALFPQLIHHPWAQRQPLPGR